MTHASISSNPKNGDSSNLPIETRQKNATRTKTSTNLNWLSKSKDPMHIYLTTQKHTLSPSHSQDSNGCRKDSHKKNTSYG